MDILQILCYDILPLLFFIGAGYLLDSQFKLDLNTYNKLVICVILPCFIFYSMVQYTPDWSSLFLLPALIALLAILWLLSRGTAVLLGITGPRRAVYQAVSTYSNAGNIGIVLIVFIYSHIPYIAEDGATPFLDEARGSVVLLLILMNIAVNLFGACQIHAAQVSARNLLSFAVRMPALYAVLAALLVQAVGFPVKSTFLWPVLHHFSGAFIVMITIIVGAHVHRSRPHKPSPAILAATAQKLLAAPLIAWSIIEAAGCFSPVEAQVFLITASIPPSFTIVMYAAEYRNHSYFAAQSVLLSTFLSLITMTAAIYAARILYPAL